MWRKDDFMPHIKGSQSWNNPKATYKQLEVKPEENEYEYYQELMK